MGKPLLGDLSCRQQDCLQSLVRIVGVLGATWKRPEIISSHALRLLSMILDNSPDGPCILDWDCFGVLVPLTFSLPSLFLTEQPTPIPSGSIQDLNMLRLLLLSHIVKILLTTDFNEGEMKMDVEGEEVVGHLAAESSILKLLSSVRKVATITIDEDAAQLDARSVWRRVRMKAEILSFHTHTHTCARALTIYLSTVSSQKA
jgi:E3 ubiquitin-protein ligase UBR2